MFGDWLTLAHSAVLSLKIPEKYPKTYIVRSSPAGPGHCGADACLCFDCIFAFFFSVQEEAPHD